MRPVKTVAGERLNKRKNLFRLLAGDAVFHAAVNKLSGAQEIQIQAAAEGWLDCINFVDDQFSMATTTKEPSLI